MSAITTHVLDLASGRPASGVPVRLEVVGESGGWIVLARAVTDGDGRARELLASGARLDAGRYRLTFDTGAYFGEREIASFYPEVAVQFEVRDASQHYHVPLLLSPFGYSTYRGS
jgi:5-hydroxyisourate hydrolase